MQISPICYEFNEFSYQRQEKDKVSFKNVTKPLNKGFLKKTTIYKMDTILHAYRDIIEKLKGFNLLIKIFQMLLLKIV